MDPNMMEGEYILRLHKEFDLALIDLETFQDEKKFIQKDMLYSMDKMLIIDTCFNQLMLKYRLKNKVNTKNERDLVNVRAELSETYTQNFILKKDRDAFLQQYHENKLKHVPDGNMEYDAQHIQGQLQFESHQPSPALPDKGKDVNLVEKSSLQNEVTLLRRDLTSLRNSITSLYSELYGARFTAKFFDEDLGGRRSSVCSALEGPLDISPNLHSGDSLAQKEDICSSGNNNAGHNKLDNIEGQTTSQQTVDNPTIESSLGSKSVDYNICPSELLALEVIKAKKMLKKLDSNVNDKKNLYAFPEPCSSTNLEPSSVPTSESSDNPPPISIHRPFVKPGPGKSKYLEPLRFSRV